MTNLKPSDSEQPYILAIIDSHPEASRILRAAKRKAKEINAFWEIVVLEYSSDIDESTEESHEQLLQTLALAQQMEVPIIKMGINSACQKIISIINAKKEQGFKTEVIYIGDTNDISWLPMFFQSPISAKLRRKIDSNTKIVKISFGVEVVHGHRLAKFFRGNLKDIFFCLLAVLIATGVIETLNYLWPQSIGNQNSTKSIIYIIACAFAASRHGLFAGIIASFLGTFMLSVSHVQSSFSLTVKDDADVMSLARSEEHT